MKKKTKKTNMKEENKRIILFFIIIIFIFSVINIVINRISIRKNELITESSYTITEASKEQISKIPDEEEIKIYLFDYKEDDYVYEFAKKYEELNNKINVEIKNAQEEDNEIVSNYGVKEGEYNILIISGEKSRLYEDNDLYSYDYNTGNIIDLTEQRLTSGIISVSSFKGKMPLYILKGHEKYGIDNELSILKRYIELENYEVKELDLSSEDIPEDCNTIVITALNSDFPDEETKKIKDYINNGGNILWFEDARFEETEFNNKKSILEIYGIEDTELGVIFEQDKDSIIIQNPYLILPEINASDITKELSTEGKVMFYYSSKLSFADDDKLNELNITKTDLLSTSEKALFKTDLSNAAMTKAENDEEGKFIVGALLEKSVEENTSKLVIYANNYFITNQNVTIGKEEIPVVDLYNNKELVQNSIDYLSENKDNIKIRKIVPRNYYIGIEDESVKQAIIAEAIILVILIIAIIFLIKRKNLS